MKDNLRDELLRQWREERLQEEREKLQKEVEELLAQIPDGIDQFDTEFGYILERADIDFRKKGYTQSVLDSLLDKLPLWYDKFNLIRHTQLRKDRFGQQEIPPGESPIDTYDTFIDINDPNHPSHPRHMGRLLARAKKLTTSLWGLCIQTLDENTRLNQRVAELEAQPAPKPQPAAAASASKKAASNPQASKQIDPVDPAALEALRRQMHSLILEVLTCTNPAFTEEILLAIEQSLADFSDTAPLVAHIDLTLVQSDLLPSDFARSNLMCQFYAAFSSCRGRGGALILPQSIQTAFQRYYRQHPQ